VDIGVTEITYPINPKFGQTIYPRVKIKNFGLDTLYDAQVAYRPYGVHLARIGDFHSDAGIAPGEVTMYTFATPFVVRNDFPDTFQIVAFTVNNLDIYKENDTTIKDFCLSPLDNDVALTEFVYPLDRVIAGDSLQVTTRIRNYGQAPVSDVDVTFIYNNAYTVTEHVDFNALMGRSLNSFEYFNYTFIQKVRASMGMMTMTAYVSMDNDDYIYNDTVTKRIDGISAITDLRAKEIIVDTSLHEHVRVMLAVENVGARGANDFEMGFWYYNDTNTLVRATYHAERPLPALSTLYYTFDTLLPPHAQYYRYVTAFVHIDGDNDPSNDTTSSIGQQYVELLPVRLLVQENRYDTCSVRMEVKNIGNIPNSRIFKLKATINGTEIYNNNVNRVVPPGQVITLNFNKVIPKSPTRTYVGVGRLTNSDDTDTSNNQTNVIDVQNYFEGIPVVSDASGMVLEQNFPNPFESATRIDFYIPSAGDVRFFIIDELGRLVYQSVESYNEGSNSIELNNLQISTGVYYYGIEMNGERLMKKMVYKR
ncbi:MAG: T9SS type A sorting domain-containing protein, partial [Bacteroidales bacterium]|nr:T9SS type A sorting domain-containing protein [Bacteroidales bacterium]